MNFRTKNFIFQCIGKTPFPDTLHYALQKYVTHSVVRSDERYSEMYRFKVQDHLTAFAEYGIRPITQSTYYEFGSGWDLFAPLGFSAAGMQELICVDLRAHVHAQDIERAASFYARHADVLNLASIADDPLPTAKDDLRRALRERYRIRYEAPCDARDTKLPAESVDFIVSNCTMEHIPFEDIPHILSECVRLLRPGGILSWTVDYQDHWSYADPSISVYNFLAFEQADWKKLNPDLHYQNRLRHSDYVRLLEESGLLIRKVTPLEIRSEDRTALHSVSLAYDYRTYDIEDLLIRGAHFVLQKGS